MILQIIFSFLVSCNVLLATEPLDKINTEHFNLYAMNKRRPVETAFYICRFANDAIKLASSMDMTPEASYELRKLEEMLAKVESLEYTEDETVEIGNIFREYKEQILSGLPVPEASKTACYELTKVFGIVDMKDRRDFLSNNVDKHNCTRLPVLLKKAFMHGATYTLDSICNIPSTILRLILNQDDNTSRFSFFENMLEDVYISKEDLGKIYTQPVARLLHALPGVLSLSFLYDTSLFSVSCMSRVIPLTYLYGKTVYPLFLNLKDLCNCSESTFEMIHTLLLIALLRLKK